MTRKALTAVLCFLLAISAIAAAAQQEARTLTRRWSEIKARAWAGAQPWTFGCNYIPRTAVNTLEMWQAETFDPATIDQELGWAEGLGGFLKRLDRFLAIADKHHIGTMFVLFDSGRGPGLARGSTSAAKARPLTTAGIPSSAWVPSRRPDRASTTRAGCSALVVPYHGAGLYWLTASDAR